MVYSDTGNFTKEQRHLCKKIRELINAAKKKDLIFKVNKNKLCAYLLDEIDCPNCASKLENAEGDLKDYDHPIKSLNCGIINQNIGENEYSWEIDDINEKGEV